MGALTRACVAALAAATACGGDAAPEAAGESSASTADAATQSTASGDGGSSTGAATTGADGTASTGDAVGCAPGSRPGAVGVTDGLFSAFMVNVNVRTPDDYDPTVPVPLLVVFAPGTLDAMQSEGFTGLTAPALEEGYIVAYVDAFVPTTPRDADGLASIAAEVAQVWCVDEARVFFTGHSNGGSATTRIGAFGVGALPPAAIAPRAAGVAVAELEALACPAPVPVMVIHSAEDELFALGLGYGADVAQWWAECNGCPGAPTDDGACARYEGCEGGTEVLYCETIGAHGVWQGLEAEMFAFFRGRG